MIDRLVWKIRFNRIALAYEIKSALLNARIKISRARNKHFQKIIDKLGVD